LRSFDGKVASITGAGSGIGRALAESLTAHGAELALSDVDESGLAETVRRCAQRGARVTSSVVDVSNRASVFEWAAQVEADHGRINLIFNNAGVALGATVESMSQEDFDWLMGINLGGVVNGTQAFLPYLVRSGEGHIVNISSVFGLIGIPTQSAYNAAKFAVRGFTEALRVELDIAGNGVSATCVHPGGVKTNIARRARRDAAALALAQGHDIDAEFDRIARTTPEKAAAVILRGVRRDARRVLVGADAHLIDAVAKMPVSVYQKLLATGAKRSRRGVVETAPHG
jgi:butyryl-CoA dehydrogenase